MASNEVALKPSNLSLLGKITIVKNLILPNIIYRALNIPVIMPANYYKLLNKMIYKFIWASNWEKISRIKLRVCNAYADDGGQMIDIQSYVLALQIKWSYYFFNNNFEQVWKTIETCALNNHLLNVILRSNLNVTHKLIRKMMPLVTTRTMLHTIKKFCDGIPSDK